LGTGILYSAGIASYSHKHSGTYEVPLTFSTGLYRNPTTNVVTNTITQYTNAMADARVVDGITGKANLASPTFTGTVTASTIKVNGSVTTTGNFFTRDIIAYRPGGTTGCIFFNSNTDRSLLYDGTRYIFQGSAGDVTINQTGAINTPNTITAINFILSSDRRLKANIKPLDFSSIGKINFVQFTMKSDSTNRKRFGVIAQEVEKTNPELVYTDNKGMKSVAYIDMLVAIVADLRARVEELERQRYRPEKHKNRFTKLFKKADKSFNTTYYEN